MDNGLELLNVLAEERRGELRLAGVHPVDVAAQGVDLAVVRHVAVGVRAVPTREGVRAETRVDQREGAFHAGIGEVGIEFRDLRRGQHAFEDNGAGGKARDVEEAAAGSTGVADFVEKPVADNVELSLESELVFDRRVAADKSHTDFRFLGFGGLTEGRVVGRHGAPAEELLPFGTDDLLEALLDFLAELLVGRQENHGHAVVTRRREGDVFLFGHGFEEFVRHLDQDAGAIARVFLEPAGSAVLEIDQNLQPLLDDFVRLHALHVGDEAHAARFVLELRVVEPLAFGSFHGLVRSWSGRTVKNRDFTDGGKGKLARRRQRNDVPTTAVRSLTIPVAPRTSSMVNPSEWLIVFEVLFIK